MEVFRTKYGESGSIIWLPIFFLAKSENRKKRSCCNARTYIGPQHDVRDN